jgi:acetolactate synthase-1/3 small subunit
LFDDRQIQNIIKDSNARIVTVNKEFFVLEKSGRRKEIDNLYDKLNEYGILQFVRSGVVSITKQPMNISEILSEFKN